MTQFLNLLQKELPQLYGNDEQTASLLDECYTDTKEFKMQLKKAKAHLNKYIQEEECETKLIEEQNTKNAKKRTLIVDKIDKSYKQWCKTVDKNLQEASGVYTKTQKHIFSKLNEMDIDSLYVNELPHDARSSVESAIGYHLARYGLFDVQKGLESTDKLSDHLNEVYGLEKKTASIYLLMGDMVQDILDGNTARCLNWCEKGTDLHFELCKLQMLHLLKNDDVFSAFDYLKHEVDTSLMEKKCAQANNELSPLLARAMLNQKVENMDELFQNQMKICISQFSKEFCLKERMPVESPLFQVVLSGIISFQFFSKYKNIKKALHVDWTTEDELPFEVKLPKFLSSFHPIFICPVLKEETTDENPPYSLPCHHVISKKALEKLSKNGTTSFKCPYCPDCASMSATRKVTFIVIS